MVRQIASTVAIFGFCLISAPQAMALSEDVPTAEKPKKITDRSHPDYVRCRSEAVIGSRVKKKRICMTNSQWKEYARNGNKESRDFVESSEPGFFQ